MITEWQQELACLYVLGALPEEEMLEFEKLLRTSAELREFARTLRDVTGALAASVAVQPTARLRKSILASVRQQGEVATPDFIGSRRLSPWFQWVPWAAAACAVASAAWLYQSAADARRQLVAAEARSSEQSRQVLLLQAELSKAEARDRWSQMKIAVLDSLWQSSPKTVAVSLWDPVRQDGMLLVQHLARQPAEKDYQLWVIDPDQAAPIDAGVFSVDDQGVVRFFFKPKADVKHPGKFAVTVEQKGGVTSPKGQMVLAGTWL